MLIFTLVVLLIFFIAATSFLGWYNYKMTSKYSYFSEDIDVLNDVLGEYAEHVKIVSEMEAFYGDEVLMNLLRHSRAIKAEVQDFTNSYSMEVLTSEDEEEELYDRDDDEEDDSGAETPPSRHRQAVFHQGS